VHQDHVTGRGSILDDLEWYPINVFDMFVKPRDPHFRIARGAQIPEVWMPVREIYGAAHLEPSVEVDSQKTTDVQDDVIRLRCSRRQNVVRRRSASRVFSRHRGATAGRRNRHQCATCVRYIPFTPDRELQEESAPITRFLPRLALQYLIDRLDRTHTSDSAKSEIGLQVLQVHRPRRRASRRIVAMDSELSQRSPNDIAHCGRVPRTKHSGDADPPLCSKVFQGGLRMRHLRAGET
jgi:hypothetical protein